MVTDVDECTIIVDARDRYSCTAECLSVLLANSPEAQEIIGVFGGAPKHLQAMWKSFWRSCAFISKNNT